MITTSFVFTARYLASSRCCVACVSEQPFVCPLVLPLGVSRFGFGQVETGEEDRLAFLEKISFSTMGTYEIGKVEWLMKFSCNILHLMI